MKKPNKCPCCMKELTDKEFVEMLKNDATWTAESLDKCERYQMETNLSFGLLLVFLVVVYVAAAIWMVIK